MRILRMGLGVVALVAVTTAAIEAYRESYFPNSAMAAGQDVIGLDRRISSLEQRLYSIQSSINRLEQQAIMSQRSASPTTGRDPELALLRSELDALKARVAEVECGLVHIDERTLSAEAKEARRRSGATASDACRLSPQAPVKLSRRP